jgi:uncharacterized protein YcbK (DUF882 family)
MDQDPLPLSSPLRRRLLLGGAGLLASQLTTPAWSQNDATRAAEFWLRPRTISLRTPQGERITSTFWSDGELIQSAYQELSWFMRDRVENKGVWMHPTLLDITYGVYGWLTYHGIREPLQMNSAHRTTWRNNNIEGAAKNGEHTKGKALDIRINGVNTRQVSAFGLWLGGGGVGFYPNKNFTHLDCGRLRYWKG